MHTSISNSISAAIIDDVITKQHNAAMKIVDEIAADKDAMTADLLKQFAPKK